jgi:hypothetical protein
VTDLVTWTGPVANFQVKGATVPGAKELFIGCCGDLTPPCTPPTCPTIGNQLAASPSALATKAGVSELGELFFGAFSAGGSIIKRLMMNEDYRRKTAFVHLADATYTGGWVDKAKRVPPHIEGFVRYAVDAIEGPGDKLMVATASPVPNYQWASGIENLQAIRQEIEKRTGKTFERVRGFGIEKEPEYAYRLGNVLLGEYSGGSDIGHGHNVLAGDIWQKILHPWLAKGKGSLTEPGGLPPEPVPPVPPVPGAEAPAVGVVEVLALAGGAAAGYLLIRGLSR